MCDNSHNQKGNPTQRIDMFQPECCSPGLHKLVQSKPSQKVNHSVSKDITFYNSSMFLFASNCRTASFVGNAGIAPQFIIVIAAHMLAKYNAFWRRFSSCHAK